MAAATEITIGTRRVLSSGSRDYRYIGVLRLNGKVAIECGHEHANRQESSRSGGTSARDCMTRAVRAVALPASRDYVADELRTAYLRQRGGFQISTKMAEEVKAACVANADAFIALVDRIANLLATNGLRAEVTGRMGKLAIVSTEESCSV